MTRPAAHRAASARNVVPIIMFCHFIAAFAALGMPPFFTLILEKSLHEEGGYLAGWLYVVPTLFAALSAPWWGRLADRFGKKPLLIRAQIGLAISFLLAGFSSSTWMFFLALVLQGVLGGTFAASNAYLATVSNGAALTRSLTAMQWSARAALVAAPASLGLWASIDSPIVLYRYLAALPLLAAVLIAMLPAGGQAAQAAGKLPTVAAVKVSARQIYLLQLTFVFATVMTFPYFIAHVQEQFGSLSLSAAGLLFGVPHLVYLLVAMPLTRWMGTTQLLATASLAFLMLAASIAVQAQPLSLAWLVGGRVLMGMSMTVGFIALHALIAAVVESNTAGKTFGWFESSSKWGGALAGLCAGAAVEAMSTHAPFILASIAIAAGAVYAAVLANSQLRLSKSY